MRRTIAKRRARRTGGKGDTAAIRGPLWRNPKARLWTAAAAAALALLLLLLTGDERPAADGAAHRASVERRTENTYELVDTSWDEGEEFEATADYDDSFMDSDELRLRNEARERWQNLDVAIEGR